ncbi:putative holin [Halomonas pacifica]|uniref:putative holin n=1 Tax=Bisbaumannia pacifica TaxID=77098 RepID=UPI0023582812|nr:putative holin [Halomonas pacifica]MDC8804234.1 putative holin [Halomonas pacifica]
MNRQSLLDKLRLGPWLILALICAAIVGLLYPHQLGVLLWSLTKLSAGAYLGYWIDRSIFCYARPHLLMIDAMEVSGSEKYWLQFAIATLRRAIIIAAAILALGLGV